MERSAHLTSVSVIVNPPLQLSSPLNAVLVLIIELIHFYREGTEATQRKEKTPCLRASVVYKNGNCLELV